MADDAVLKITTVVDISGAQQLAAGTQEAMSKIIVAQQNVRDSASRVKDIYKELGQAAQQGSAAAQAAINQEISELAEARAQLQEAQEDYRQLGRSKDSATESTVLFTDATRAESAAVRGGISDRQAASASLRLFEGGMTGSTRAAGALLTGVLGLGPIIQAAFPIIGAIALLEVLAEFPKILSEIKDWWAGVTEESKKALAEQASSFQTELQFAVSLKDQQTRLAEGPLTGASRTKQEIEDYKSELAVLGQVQTALSNASSARYDLNNRLSDVGRDRIRQDMEQMESAVKNSGVDFHLDLPKVNFDASEKEFKKEADSFLEHIEKFNEDLSHKVQTIGTVTIPQLQFTLAKEDAAQQEATAREVLEVQLASINAQKAAAQLLYQQGTIDAKQWLEAQTTADGLAYQAHEDYFTKVKALYASNPQKEAALEAEQSKFAYDELAKAYADGATELAKYEEQLRKLKEDNAAAEATKQKEELDQHTKSVMDMVAALHAQGEAQQGLADSQQQFMQQTKVEAINNSAALGLISEKQKAERLQDLYEKEEKALLEHLQDMRDEQQQNVTALQSAVTADPSNTALKTALATAQAQVAQSDQHILQVQQQFGAQINAQQLTIWKQMEAPMNTFFNSMQQGITRATGEWLTGSRSFASAFEQSIGQMIVAEVQWGEKTLLNDAAVWAKKAILHQTANATAAASNAAAAAQQVTTTVATDTAQVISEAGLAAAKAYAAYAEFPPIAAVMAAEAEATVLGFLPQASAEGGFDVPSLPSMGMLTNIHSREMVLPQEHADVIRGLAGGGAARGGDFHYHAGDVSALDGNGVEQALNNNRKHVTNMVKQAIRRGAINPRKII